MLDSANVWLLMISGTEGLSDIFSVFHDGGITRYSANGANLELEVEVPYLAERVNPAFRSFRVALLQVQNLSFTTWPKDREAEPSILRLLSQIFEPELEILSGEVDGELIKVICNQSDAGGDYCGGELFFSAVGATVTDEGGKEYSIDELRQLSSEYWQKWSDGHD